MSLQPDGKSTVWEWDGFSPVGDVPKLMRLRQSCIMQHFIDTGNHAKIDEAFWVPDVTMKPAVIFRGLKRYGQSQAYCYAGIPSGDFARKHGRDLDFPKSQTFLVFLTPDFEVTKWRPCEMGERNGFPVDFETRFEVKLWPQD